MNIEQRPAEIVLDQAAGSLVGLAVGDALGGPVEGLTAAEIAGRHGFLMEMVGGGHLGLDPGETTDDTAQTIAIAESLLARRGLDPADIADRFSLWYLLRPKGLGTHTTSVLDRMAGGEDWEIASLKVQAQNPQSAGNGSLMRCAPIALMDHATHAVLIENSRLGSRITHPHASCQWSCAFVNLIIAELLSGSEITHAVDNALATCGHRGDVFFPVLERARNAALSADAGVLNPGGHVLDTLECAIWALVHHDSFEQAVGSAVNLGGDADTIGAVTGALAGAAYGFESIPERWLIHINNWQLLKDLAQELVKNS